MQIVQIVDGQTSGANTATTALDGGRLFRGRVFLFRDGPSSAGAAAFEVSPDGGTTFCSVSDLAVSSSNDVASAEILGTHYRINPSGYSSGAFSLWLGTA